MIYEFMNKDHAKRMIQLRDAYNSAIDDYFFFDAELQKHDINKTPIKEIRYKQNRKAASDRARAIDTEREAILTRYSA